ncbi:hypothetical protein ACFQ60_44205 [Streptomyces zhihengii]
MRRRAQPLSADGRGRGLPRVDALEPGAAGRAYLRSQLDGGADASWEPFYALCRGYDPALPPRLDAALARVRVVEETCGALRRAVTGSRP